MRQPRGENATTLIGRVGPETRVSGSAGRTDETVLDSAQQSGRMFQTLRRMNPHAPIDEFVGDWPHTEAMRAETDLPKMLAGLGLLTTLAVEQLDAVHKGPPAQERCTKR
jgi:hypothetical protein